MSTEDMIQNLRDAGCGQEAISRFLTCMATGETKKGMKLLERQRRELLDSIHEGQRRLDCLDYLVYQMSK